MHDLLPPTSLPPLCLTLALPPLRHTRSFRVHLTLVLYIFFYRSLLRLTVFHPLLYPCLLFASSLSHFCLIYASPSFSFLPHPCLIHVLLRNLPSHLTHHLTPASLSVHHSLFLPHLFLLLRLNLPAHLTHHLTPASLTQRTLFTIPASSLPVPTHIQYPCLTLTILY